MTCINFTKSLFQFVFSKKSLYVVLLNLFIIFLMAFIYICIQQAYIITKEISVVFSLIFGLIFWCLLYLILGQTTEYVKRKKAVTSVKLDRRGQSKPVNCYMNLLLRKDSLSDLNVIKIPSLNRIFALWGIVVTVAFVIVMIIILPYSIIDGEIRMFLAIPLIIFALLSIFLFSLYSMKK